MLHASTDTSYIMCLFDSAILAIVCSNISDNFHKKHQRLSLITPKQQS